MRRAQRRKNPIQIHAAYLTENLVKIVGKKEEIIYLPVGSRSGHLIDYMAGRYPKLFETYGPGYLGFTRNGEKPKAMTLLRDGDRYEFADWTDEEIEADEIMTRLEELGAVMKLPQKEFTPPVWWDCAWRRVSCWKDECRICGKIKQDRIRHTMKGEDPDDMKSVFEDTSSSLGEVLAMIKQHAAEMGIEITNINKAELEDPPKQDTFPLYQKASQWHGEVNTIIKDADLEGNAWLLTEAAADLGWYKNTLLVKIYRQLCNRWHLDRGDEYGEVDYAYTKYVLGECVKILKNSLGQLAELSSSQKDAVAYSLCKLTELEHEIEAI